MEIITIIISALSGFAFGWILGGWIFGRPAHPYIVLVAFILIIIRFILI